jgi:hypothetical protein
MAKFIKSENVNVYLDRYVKNKEIIRLKRWIYVSQEKINKIKSQNKFNSYLQYITTNILISPSYLSCEYVLAQNWILIENVYSITAITTKKTNNIKNIFSNFIYQNINSKLFRWYETKKDWDFIYFQAYPEKALIDRIRLKTDIVLSLDYFKELRLELDNINFKRLKEFVKKFNKKKINNAFLLLQKLKWL